MRNHFLRAIQKGSASSASVEFIGGYGDDVNRSVFTFSVPVTAGLLVIAVHGENNPHTVNSVTVEGNNATSIGTSYNGTQRVSLYQYETSTTGSVNVVVSLSSTLTRLFIGVWRIYNNSSNTAITSGTASGTSQSSLSTTLNSLPSSAVVIAAALHGTGTRPSTLTGVDESYDETREAGMTVTGGYSIGNSGNTTVTVSYGVADGGQVLVAAAWS